MAMKTKDFAVFILSHGRADKCLTYNSLLKAGYTGKIYILIDNEDKTADKYYKNFGDKVIMFDKKAIADKIDVMDNFEGRKAIVYARNANFEIAKNLGLKYFLQLDDDYTQFQYRFNSELAWEYKEILNIDKVFDILLTYFSNTNIRALAFAQNGDFIGGSDVGELRQGLTMKRKCMNTWFFDVDKPVNFVGKMNEDLTASIYYGSLGKLFFTVYSVSINQITTQAGSGGMSDIYQDNGTYVKTFYSIMIMPSCVKVSMMQTTHSRLHHKITWNNAVPKIISEEYKRA